MSALGWYPSSWAAPAAEPPQHATPHPPARPPALPVPHSDADAFADDLRARGCSELAEWARLAAQQASPVAWEQPMQPMMQPMQTVAPLRERDERQLLCPGAKRQMLHKGQSSGAIGPLDADGFTLG